MIWIHGKNKDTLAWLKRVGAHKDSYLVFAHKGNTYIEFKMSAGWVRLKKNQLIIIKPNRSEFSIYAPVTN